MKRRWLKYQNNIRGGLANSYLHKIFGARIFHPKLWAFDRSSVVSGLCFGLFVAFTPTIPFQMLICVCGALVFHFSLPMSVIACWVTNPFTAAPVYLAAFKLGKWMLEDTFIIEFLVNLFGENSNFGRFMEGNVFIWAGSFVFSLIACILGIIIGNIIWWIFARIRRQAIAKYKEARRKRRAEQRSCL